MTQAGSDSLSAKIAVTVQSTEQIDRQRDQVMEKLRAHEEKTGQIVTGPVGGARAMRRYLPTLAELIDRLSIVQMKAIFLGEHSKEYQAERELIEHDIDVILSDKRTDLTSREIRAILMIMLTNRYIWENESKARQGGTEQDKLLKLTHSINGVRNRAKNELAKAVGDRVDHKLDCFAAELVEEFGNWRVFEDKTQ